VVAPSKERQKAAQSAYATYLLYISVMTVLGLGGLAIGLAPAFGGPAWERVFIWGMSVHHIWGLFWGLPTLAAFGTALLLPKSRASWIYGLILIALGLYTVVLLPVMAPLLRKWVQPETKELFEKKPKSAVRVEPQPTDVFDEGLPSG
jgi:hypothetical protein